MLLLTRLTPDRIRRFLDSQRDASFSYPEVGASRTGSPPGYNVDHNRVQLGEGREAFERAVAAVRAWTMFDLGWVTVHPPRQPIEVGTTVAVVASHFGLWSMSATRIVYTVEESGPVRRYGFAYGTLMGHVERGEERFTVEWHSGDDSVWYDLYAFSRPKHPLARLGYPLSRHLQKRFARDSKAAMVRGSKE